MERIALSGYKQDLEYWWVDILIRGTDAEKRKVLKNNGIGSVLGYLDALRMSRDTIRACKTLADVRSIAPRMHHKDAGLEERTFTDPNGFTHGLVLRTEYQLSSKQTLEILEFTSFTVQDVNKVEYPSSAKFEEIIKDEMLAVQSGIGRKKSMPEE